MTIMPRKKLRQVGHEACHELCMPLRARCSPAPFITHAELPTACAQDAARCLDALHITSAMGSHGHHSVAQSRFNLKMIPCRGPGTAAGNRSERGVKLRKLSQHGSLGCARRWGSSIRQIPTTTADPRRSLQVHLTAEHETSEIVSPLAARFAQCSPTNPGHRPPSDNFPIYLEAQITTPSYHALSKPRWRFAALQIPLESSAAAALKLTSSQILSSTHANAAKNVFPSPWCKLPVRTPRRRVDSLEANRHQHDLPQMPSLKLQSGQWYLLAFGLADS